MNTVTVESLTIEDLVKQFAVENLIFVGELFPGSNLDIRCVVDTEYKIEDGYKIGLKGWDHTVNEEVKNHFYISDFNTLIERGTFSVYLKIGTEILTPLTVSLSTNSSKRKPLGNVLAYIKQVFSPS